jgi:hypothetical protein
LNGSDHYKADDVTDNQSYIVGNIDENQVDSYNDNG